MESREQLVQRASDELIVGLDAAAQMIADWLKTHEEPLQPLCKNVATQAGIPEAWNALRGRVQRMQTEATGEAESERTRRNLSSTRAGSYLKNAEPEQVEELLEDPKVRAKIARAAARVEAKKIEQTDDDQKKRAPGLVKRYGFSDTVATLFQAKRSYAMSLERVRELDLDDEEREALLELVNSIGVVHDWFKSFLESDTKGFDSALADLLAESSQ